MTVSGDQITLKRAIQQIEANCYEQKRIDGETVKIPNAKKVKEYVKVLYTCMDTAEWSKLATAYKDIMFGSLKPKKKKGRPRGKNFGLSGGARASADHARAQALGVWDLKYPDGCTDCGGKSYRHCSGGLCNRCYSLLRELGLTITDYRRMKESGKLDNEN